MFRWFDVEPQDTNNWDVYYKLGRSYGKIFLNYLDTADRKDEFYPCAFQWIASFIVRQGSSGPDDGLYIGFFGVISE